ncbi:anosmin-1-like isoform X3 [Prorops nasuta]|uniref:anosmin-1-like isoform X3 n=1 Tax=Prorops nasuta TaxID=863751 RepID=UPI0034CE18DE
MPAVRKYRRDTSEVSCCLKYVIFGFNVMFWWLGFGITAVGIWAWAEKDTFNNLSRLTNVALDPAFILILVGTVTFIIGFTGCVGALRENTCLLAAYAIFLAILLLLEMTAGVLGFIFKDWIKSQATGGFQAFIIHYREDPDQQNLIDWIQEDWLQCCGIEGPKDWDRNNYFNCSSSDIGSREACGVPFSCCKRKPNEIIKNKQCGYDVRKSSYCMENCLASNYTKPGYCPEKTSMSPFEAACLVACNGDFRCPELAKCCSHDCGVTCMHPIGLDNITDLPPIPENLQIRQQKSNLIHLTWKSNNGQLNNTYTDGDIRYLLEERHLLGPRYLESRLSPWTIRHVSTKPYAALRDRLRSGHWYQFRVAAVNSEGSRGYSLPSRPFKTKEPRSPKEPQNLTLFGARLVGGKLRINIRWTKPASDVPIAFYKVFWSRLIRGPTNDSILVYHRTVLKQDKTCYELKNLELKCQYFLQVQAVALYGGRRLASRKASKVFNGTDYMAFEVRFD